MLTVLLSIQTIMPYVFWGTLLIGLSGIIIYSVIQEKYLKGQTYQWVKRCQNQKNRFFD